MPSLTLGVNKGRKPCQLACSPLSRYSRPLTIASSRVLMRSRIAFFFEFITLHNLEGERPGHQREIRASRALSSWRYNSSNQFSDCKTDPVAGVSERIMVSEAPRQSRPLASNRITNSHAARPTCASRRCNYAKNVKTSNSDGPVSSRQRH